MDGDQRRVRELLLPSERLLWVGRPDPRAHFVPADAFLIPFGLLWTAFAFFFEGLAITRGAPTLVVLWGVPFVLIGFYYVFGRFIYKSYAKRRTVYALTDRRVLILKGDIDFDEQPVRSEKMAMSTSTFAGRLSVRFDTGAKSSFLRPLAQANEMYANTGMEFFARGGITGLRFFDVADVDGLRGALQELRVLNY